MANPGYQHTTTLLQEGNVLVSGGYNGVSRVANAEVFDPRSDDGVLNSASAA